MALTTCRECGGQISTGAKACPHCGAQAAKTIGRTSPATWGCLIVALLFGIPAIIAAINKDREQPQQKASQSVVVDPAKQQQRKELIDKLIANGVFQKVERPAQLPHVWVTPQFTALKFDDKQNFISVVFAYYYPDGDSSGLVSLFDSQTGKEIGVYGVTAD